jgi:hypothetical protein
VSQPTAPPRAPVVVVVAAAAVVVAVVSIIIIILIIIMFNRELLMQKWGERIFSNRLLGMRVYIRIATIMVLE